LTPRRGLVAANLAGLALIAAGLTIRHVDAAVLDVCRSDAPLVVTRARDPYLDPYFAWDTATGGVVMYQGVLHPVATASSGILALRDGDRASAEAALSALKGIVDPGVPGMLPYAFDWDSGWWHMKVPWYSAMAQGQALSLAVRLGDHGFAGDLVPTLLPGSPVVWQDGGDTWLEEYVTAPHNPVLNGAIFASFGLYDAWLATGSDAVHSQLVASFKTIRRHLPAFRRPGEASQYDLLGHARAWPDGNYAKLHVVLLREVAAMTGDACYAAAADAIRRDNE